MRCDVPYGSDRVYFDVPDESIIFNGRMKTLPALKSLKNAIWDALDNPIGTAPLKELVKGKKKILFLVEDSTRSTPLSQIMPVVVRRLNDYGIQDECMSFLTAPGTHRLMTDDEIEEKLGPEIVARFKIYQHDVNRHEDLVNMGVAMAGDYPVPVWVNRRALDADFIFGLGNIVPHTDAGYSGGAKILQPGICGFSTTAATHVAAAFCPDIPLGMKDDNPCRRGMEEVAAKVGLSFILNVVKNCDNEVCGVFAGDFLKAHRKGVDMSEESFKVSIPEQADIVVVSSYPADNKDYWQAGKGRTSAYFAVKQGGIIIVVAPCPEGLASNHPKFREWLSKPLDEVLIGLRACSPEDEDADLVSAVIAAYNCRARERADIFVVTEGLCDLDFAALQYKPFKTVQDALNEAMSRIPSATVGILPQGGISLPVIEKELIE